MQSNTHWILIFSFSITLMIFIGIISYSLGQFEEVRDQSRNIVQQNNTKSELIFTMLSSARERVVDLFSMVNNDDPFERDDIFLDFKQQGIIFLKARIQLLKHELNINESAIMEEQGRLTRLSVPIQLQLIDLIRTDKFTQAKTLLNDKAVDAQNLVIIQLSKLLELQHKKSHDTLNDIDEKHENSKRLILIWSFIALIVGAIIAFFVIIKTTRIERDLFKEIENSRATLTSINDVIIRINNSGKIVFTNPKANNFFERSILNEHIKNTLTAFTNIDLDSHQKNLGKFHLINNKSRWIEVAQELILDENNKSIGKVFLLHDISDVMIAHKHLEDANENLEINVQERTKKLQTTNQKLKESLDTLAAAQKQLIHSEKMAALGGLVAGISHEINTPIGISVTSATHVEEKVKELEEKFNSGNLLKSDFEDFISHTKKGLTILISNLDRASSLIRSFKQVAVDQSNNELREIQLFEYIESVILSLHPKLKNTHIVIHNNVPSNIIKYTNPGAIYQIISNLVFNSILHAFDENSINPEITISYSMDNKNTYQLTYEDNGEGLNNDTLRKIFDPFFTTKRGQGGSGLGMSVVYNLVTTALKGEINAQSQLGKGLVLTLLLPDNIRGINNDIQ